MKRAGKRRLAPVASPSNTPGDRPGFLDGAFWPVPMLFVSAAGLLIVPHAKDSFRLPKDLLVGAEAIVLMACWLTAWVWRTPPKIGRSDRPVAVLALAAVVWTAVSATFSVNRALSFRSLAHVLGLAVIALTIYVLAGRRKNVTDAFWILVPAAVNAVVAALQTAHVWSPVRIPPDVPEVMRTTAFIGNPNDVGSYLVPALLCCLAVAIADRRWRWWCAGGAVVLLLGLLAARSATGIIAGAAGMVALAFTGTRHRKAVVAVVVVAVILTVVSVAFIGQFGTGDLLRLRDAAVLNETLSFRLVPFLAAWRMFLSDPLTGVGPGNSAFLYFDYKIEVERDHPSLFHAGQGWSNFAEVHNDHLEILAETGLPGYVLFLIVLAFIGMHSFRSANAAPIDPALERAGRLIAFPVACSLFVLCLAQFPLQLASATSSFVYVFALALGWLRR